MRRCILSLGNLMQANQSKNNIKDDFSQSVFAFEIRKYFFGAYIKNIDVVNISLSHNRKQ
jgi:hypothetical protein